MIDVFRGFLRVSEKSGRSPEFCRRSPEVGFEPSKSVFDHQNGV